MVRNQTDEMGISERETDKAREENNETKETTSASTSRAMHVQLPLESSPYVKYNDLEEYKRHAYVTLPRLQPYHHHAPPPPHAKPSN